ncbi:MAG: hypothetical protein AAGD05_01815 [Bacteroidota bacterium]
MKPLLPFFLLLLLCHCKTKQDAATSPPDTPPVPSTTTACTTEALVDDLTGLDGCGLVLLVNGQKWLPTNLADQSVRLEKNQQVVFGYRTIEDGISICMAEDRLIELTCLEVLGKTGGIKPSKRTCSDVQSAMKVDWMKALLQQHRPIRVIKYPFGKNNWVYLYRTKTQRLLYSCQGDLICQVQNGAQNDCTVTLKNLQDGTIVFQDEEPGN